MSFIEMVEVEQHYIVVTFRSIPKAVSLKNANVSLYTVEATPQKLDYLDQIVLADHYDSIRRRLAIYFADLPDEPQTLDIRFDNIVLYDGSVTSGSCEFEYNYDNGSIEPPSPEPSVPIRDMSIRGDAFVDVDNSNFLVGAADFYVVSSDPEDGSIFLETDENEGRITIEFNSSPSLAFVNEKYFKVQRKPMQTTYVKWENVANVHIRRDSNYPKVYMSLPSLNSETPVYEEPGLDYFESAYKYRIKLHSSIATETT